MKYIIINHGELEVPIIFSELMSHNDIGRNYDVVAAGFCRITTEEPEKDNVQATIRCWGGSVTLKKQSRREVDEEIIMADNNFTA